MSVNVKEKVADFVVFDFFLSQFLSLTPTPLPHITIAGPSNSRYCVFVQHFWEFKILKNVGPRHYIANSKNWKVLQLRCGEIRWQKSQPKKSKTLVRFFWTRISSLNHPPTHTHPHTHRRTLEFAILSLRQTFLRIYPSQSQDPWTHNIANSSLLRLRWGKLGDENCGRKIQKCRFDFFGCDFRHPASHTLLPPIITGHSNSRYGVFIKQFQEFTHHNRRTCDCDEGGNENHGRKNRKRRQSVEKNV